jgi:hypothetical protein
MVDRNFVDSGSVVGPYTLRPGVNRSVRSLGRNAAVVAKRIELFAHNDVDKYGQ